MNILEICFTLLLILLIIWIIASIIEKKIKIIKEFVIDALKAEFKITEGKISLLGLLIIILIFSLLMFALNTESFVLKLLLNQQAPDSIYVIFAVSILFAFTINVLFIAIIKYIDYLKNK